MWLCGLKSQYKEKQSKQDIRLATPMDINKLHLDIETVQVQSAGQVSEVSEVGFPTLFKCR